MRFAIYKGRVYALMDKDMAEDLGVGTPEDLCYALYSNSVPTVPEHIRCCDLKDCKNCENYYGVYEGQCDFIEDVTCAEDNRFCEGFQWAEQ